LHELSLAGICNASRAYGGKHLQIRWRVKGTEHMYTLPITPSDFRAVNNTRAVIRRMLRENGVLLTVERKPPAPRPPNRLTPLESAASRLWSAALRFWSSGDMTPKDHFSPSSLDVRGLSGTFVLADRIVRLFHLPNCQI
jgi:hypothetical protein